MCGIVGIVHSDRSRPVDPERIAAMCQAVAHRGPDDEGIWIGEGVGLGHRRLAIIDLSPAGHQPMTNEDGSIWTVLNGEIYNFQELRDDLLNRGHSFRSRSDTEVIVHLYEERGPSFVEALHGMFAIALWDVRRRRLVLARDRVGKKPIKYALTEDGLYFASELKALSQSRLISLDVSPEDVDSYLTFGYVPSPRTGFRGISKLPPGHRLVWEDGRVLLDRYWALDFRRKEARTPEEWRTEVRTAVRQAVERRLISDVPLGAFLSGGVDSSIVVACMAQASSKPVETFSVGFESDSHNELPYAREVATRFGTHHHEFVLRPDSAELLPRLAAQYEEPYADASALPSFLLAEETRRFVTVALNGDGGDEGFAGYTRYARVSTLSSRLAWIRLFGIRPLLSAASASANGQLASSLASRLDGLVNLSDVSLGVRYAWMCRLFSEREKRALTVADLQRSGSSPLAAFVALVDDPAGGEDALDRVLRADVVQYLPDDLCVKMDIASMAHGLETRSPLLDHAVLELAASIPASAKAPPGSLKHLLKESFRDLIPPSVLSRRKQGFSLPLNDWFRGPLLGMTRELLTSPGAHVHDYLRADVLRKFIDAHAKGAVSRGHQIWSLVMLELWHRRVVSSGRS